MSDLGLLEWLVPVGLTLMLFAKWYLASRSLGVRDEPPSATTFSPHTTQLLDSQNPNALEPKRVLTEDTEGSHTLELDPLSDAALQSLITSASIDTETMLLRKVVWENVSKLKVTCQFRVIYSAILSYRKYGSWQQKDIRDDIYGEEEFFIVGAPLPKGISEEAYNNHLVTYNHPKIIQSDLAASNGNHIASNVYGKEISDNAIIRAAKKKYTPFVKDLIKKKHEKGFLSGVLVTSMNWVKLRCPWEVYGYVRFVRFSFESAKDGQVYDQILRQDDDKLFTLVSSSKPLGPVAKFFLFLLLAILCIYAIGKLLPDNLLPGRQSTGSVNPEAVQSDRIRSAYSGITVKDCEDCPSLVVIDSGQFDMGDAQIANAIPVHRVTVLKTIAVGAYEVTFREWDACVAAGYCQGGGDSSNKLPAHDEGWGRGQNPVINVSWYDAHDYIFWLNLKTGQKYRLLSESEWEYVARAGTNSAYPWGTAVSHKNANYGNDECCEGQAAGRDEWTHTSPVGSFAANQYGLYDTQGNVWEWTQDCWHPRFEGAPTDTSPWQYDGCAERVVRGGAWIDGPEKIRSASRSKLTPESRGGYIGFRVARDYP